MFLSRTLLRYSFRLKGIGIKVQIIIKNEFKINVGRYKAQSIDAFEKSDKLFV